MPLPLIGVDMHGQVAKTEAEVVVHESAQHVAKPLTEFVLHALQMWPPELGDSQYTTSG